VHQRCSRFYVSVCSSGAAFPVCQRASAVQQVLCISVHQWCSIPMYQRQCAAVLQVFLYINSGHKWCSRFYVSVCISGAAKKSISVQQRCSILNVSECSSAHQSYLKAFPICGGLQRGKWTELLQNKFSKQIGPSIPSIATQRRIQSLSKWWAQRHTGCEY
jgi:hypothetical protein